MTTIIDAEVVLHEKADPKLRARAKATDTRLCRLRDLVGKGYGQMGRLLYEMKSQRLYLLLGFSRFEDYIEQRLGYKRRKGFYLQDIFEKLVLGAGMTEVEVSKIEWTKAAEISKVADKGNIQELLSVAKTETLVRVKQAVAEAAEKQGKGGGKVDPKKKCPEVVHVERIGLFDEQKKLWDEALRIAGTIGKTDKKPRQIELVCMEFLAGRSEDLGRSKVLEWWLKRLESAFGVKVIALDPSTMEPVYGKKVMDMLDKEND